MARALPTSCVRSEVRDQLGAAMNSQRGILLYGPAGSGKTFLCEQMARLLQDPVAIPHAVEVGGEIIRVLRPAGAQAGGSAPTMHSAWTTARGWTSAGSCANARWSSPAAS
jgi:predicted ATPase with chaperone activity